MSNELNLETLNGTIKDQYISNISMLVTLISFTMLFATLFLGYAVFRLTSAVWPPMGMDSLPMGLPLVSTLIIAISSLFYWAFERSYASRKPKYQWLWLTGFFGVLFLLSQVSLWSSLHASGLYAKSGIFGSVVFGFTWIHAAHIFMGLGTLTWLAFRIKNKKAILSTVQNVGKFWHFLGIVWLIMFITIFAI